MAADSIDPTAFTGWEEAFQYPVVSTRKLEQRLRGHAEENRQKLRTIVGTGYRDLLETADRILQMNQQMRLIEDGLSITTQKSNSRAVEKLLANTSAFNGKFELQERRRRSIASQSAILKNCARVIGRILKKRGSTLLASKILVLSRLTHKVLSQLNPAFVRIDSLGSEISSYRKNLRIEIDAKLSDPDEEANALIQHLCAYSLTTTAMTGDILKHFHSVRLKAIEECLAGEAPSNKDATKAVHILVRTFHLSQQIFPKRMTEALARLRQKPLLQHPDVRSVSELEMDMQEEWIAEELRNYTIWHRQDDLSKAESDKALKIWAREAVKAFATGLKSNLRRMTSFQEIVILRRDIFLSWPWSGNKLPGLDYAEVADDLREIINERLGQILSLCAAKLNSVLDSISSGLEVSPYTASENPLLWDIGFSSRDLLNGAGGYKRKVKNSYRGKDPISEASIKYYAKWNEEVGSLANEINKMRLDRWDDDIGDDIDDVDTDSRQIHLSSDDPRDLERVFISALESAIEVFQKGLETVINGLSEHDDDLITQRVAGLRIIRELLRHSIGQGFRSKVELKAKLGRKTLLSLQTRVARHVAVSPTKTYASNMNKAASFNKVPGKLLWQGTPALPVQSSPSAYRFLQGVSSEMASFGPDIWTSSTSVILKEQVAAAVMLVFEEACRAMAKPTATKTNGEDEETDENNESAEELKKERLTQLFFDVAYIANALRVSGTQSTPLSLTLQNIGSNADFGEAEKARMEKSAFEYWRRTYLMFALLAS